MEILRVLIELIKLFSEYKSKHERKQKQRELREALNEARTKKNTESLERFFRPSDDDDLEQRMYYGNEEILLKQLRERNQPTNLGYGLQNSKHKKEQE